LYSRLDTTIFELEGSQIIHFLKNKYITVLTLPVIATLILILMMRGISSQDIIYKVAFIDVNFSREIISKSKNVWYLVTGENCINHESLIVKNKKYCLIKNSEPSSHGPGHGHDVVKTFMAESNTQYEISLVTLDVDTVWTTDHAMVAATLLSRIDNSIDALNVSTNSEIYDPYGVGNLEEQVFYGEAQNGYGVIFWAVQNNQGSLAENRELSLIINPDYSNLVQDWSKSNIILVGAEDDGTIYTLEPEEGSSANYIAYSGWAHTVGEENLGFGSSFASPKLMAIMLNSVDKCDVEITDVKDSFIMLANKNNKLLDEIFLKSNICEVSTALASF
jgi:hypothetical protein